MERTFHFITHFQASGVSEAARRRGNQATQPVTTSLLRFEEASLFQDDLLSVEPDFAGANSDHGVEPLSRRKSPRLPAPGRSESDRVNTGRLARALLLERPHLRERPPTLMAGHQILGLAFQLLGPRVVTHVIGQRDLLEPPAENAATDHLVAHARAGNQLLDFRNDVGRVFLLAGELVLNAGPITQPCPVTFWCDCFWMW